MRSIRDAADLTAVHGAGEGIVHNRDGQVLHAASCPQAGRMGPKGKLFFDSLEEAAAYLSEDPRRHWSRCPTCLADSRAIAATQPVRAEQVREQPSAAVRAISDGFEMIAGGHVPFEPRTDEQRALRAQLREGLRALVAREGWVLHARVAGVLPAGSDIENVLLYNVDQGGGSMAAATAAGIRFEIDSEPFRPGVRYRYGLAPRASGFESWRIGRLLAEIGPCMLGSRSLRCSTAWWALKAGTTEASAEPLRPDERFAVLLDVEGPGAALRPEALKVLIDATVCSLQAHSDATTVAEVARRLGVALDIAADDVADSLCDQSRAVLGPRARLVQPWGKTVQWLPDDHLCVAGDVGYRSAREWRVSGRVCVVE